MTAQRFCDALKFESRGELNGFITPHLLYNKYDPVVFALQYMANTSINVKNAPITPHYLIAIRLLLAMSSEVQYRPTQ